MNFLGLVLLLALVVFVGLELLALVVFVFFRDRSIPNKGTQVRVSVLIAARNEEEHISRCLDSLVSMDYPKELLQILIGDDQSEDQTAKFINDYSNRFTQIESVSIREGGNSLKGKASVLAQLESKAKGEILLFTDADMVLPPCWVSEMVSQFGDEVVMINGFTGVDDQGKWFGTIQNLEWIYAEALIHVTTSLGLPVTGLGNNMGVRRSSYFSVGGFGSIPFSLTEDHELFRRINREGGEIKMIMDQNALGYTVAAQSFGDWLQQRKRWIRGIRKTPVLAKSMLLVQSVFLPLIALVTILAPIQGLIILLTRSFIRGIFMYGIQQRIGQKFRAVDFLLFELTKMVLSLVELYLFIFPGKVAWKGRTYR